MLAKRFHLPIQSTIALKGRSVRAGGLTLKIFSQNLPHGRFGIIIPKAVIKTAVQRNRLKRAAFDVFGVHVKAFSGRDVLCIVSKGAPVTKDAMMSELTELLVRQLR